MPSLTGSSLSVVPGVYVPFALAALCSCYFLHAVDFRDTQLGIESKVHLPRPDGQVPVVPVPQLLQVLVVQDIEGVVPGITEIRISNRLCLWPPPATQNLSVVCVAPYQSGAYLLGFCKSRQSL